MPRQPIQAPCAAQAIPQQRRRVCSHRRNPWNEAECGNHYARSLASWAVLVALTGADYDASSATLSFTPRLGDGLRAPFTTGTGWGELRLSAAGAEIELLGGDVSLRRLVVNHPRHGPLMTGPVHLRPGHPVTLTASDQEDRR